MEDLEAGDICTLKEDYLKSKEGKVLAKGILLQFKGQVEDTDPPKLLMANMLGGELHWISEKALEFSCRPGEAENKDEVDETEDEEEDKKEDKEEEPKATPPNCARCCEPCPKTHPCLYEGDESDDENDCDNLRHFGSCFCSDWCVAEYAKRKAKRSINE